MTGGVRRGEYARPLRCHSGGSRIGDRGRTRADRCPATLSGMTTTPGTTDETTAGSTATTTHTGPATTDASATGELSSTAPTSAPTVALPGDDAVLASDAEREHVTDRLRRAAAEGRLTLAEADERQAAAYAARTRAELVPLLAGLPRPPRPRRPQRGPLTPRARRNLGVHAGVTAAVLLFLLAAAVFGPAPLFAPIGPAFWLGLILFVHSRRAEREPAPDAALPEELR